MHGNDVIGVDTSTKPVRVLKGECKSRANFAASVVGEACEALDKHDGRPNPSTLAFIATRLYEEDRDEEAEVFRDLQCRSSIAARNIAHMIFVLSGNDPTANLTAVPKSKRGVKRDSAVIVVKDHGKFISAVFTTNGT